MSKVLRVTNKVTLTCHNYPSFCHNKGISTCGERWVTFPLQCFTCHPSLAPRLLAQSNLDPTYHIITLPRLWQCNSENALKLAWLHSTMKPGYKETLLSEGHRSSLIVVVKCMEYNPEITNAVITNNFVQSLDTLFYCGFTAVIWWVFCV